MTINSEIQGSRHLTAGALAVAIWLCAFAAPALAGPPVHPPDEDAGIGGFNHACGAAVDSEGDVYVASAGEDEIFVFDADHNELTSIPNANEPCGLAVDSHGTLFVSERETGKVVRYVPDAYPFTGTPAYDPREEVDSSGDAAGISVDGAVILTNSGVPTGGEDSLFVAAGDHVDGYRNERQDVNVSGAGGFTLEFAGQVTGSLSCGASHQEVQVALEGLSTIGAGNVSITTGNFSVTDHLIAFVGNLGLANVPKLNVGGTCSVSQSETNGGTVGPLAENVSADYTGVAAYTYQISGGEFTRYLYLADDVGDTVEVFSGTTLAGLKARRTITGVDADEDSTISSGEEFEFGSAGAYLAVDPGSAGTEVTCSFDPAQTCIERKCAQVGKQACTAGHLLLYDEAAEAVQEFDGSGQFLDRIESDEFADAEPTGLAVERSGGSNDGMIYVTAGAGAGAKLLAFEPLQMPSRLQLPQSGWPPLSQVIANPKAVATDPYGNLYVAAGPNIEVFDTDGEALTTIPDAELPYDLAIDSQCNVYVLDAAGMTYYDPGAECPPTPSTSFSRHAPLLAPAASGLKAVAVNPADDHVFLMGTGLSAPLVEFGPSPASSQERGCGSGLFPTGNAIDLALYGGGIRPRLYVSANSEAIYSIDCGEAEGEEEVVAKTKGAGGCLNGTIGANPVLAVDQSNGHLLEFMWGQPGAAAREYDAALSCVTEYGTFNNNFAGFYGIAIDNGEFSPNRGVAYVAYDSTNNTLQPFDVTAFTPLSYGGLPSAETGVADGIGPAEATLNGTVIPRGIELESCEFEYLLDSAYKQNLAESKPGFEGALAQSCAESLPAISDGAEPVPVHADLTGLSPSPQTDRYRFHLVASNEFGTDRGAPGLFGPPLISGEKALPILYNEATLRAEVDPSGLETQYHFIYGTTEAYGQSSPTVTLPPGDGPVAIEAPLTGLEEGTEYHFRLVAENEADQVEGSDREFETPQRLQVGECPNTEYRTGLSAKLPECRAYELVTPADTRGAQPGATTPPSAGLVFNNWLVDPRGPSAGESVGYFAGTLPGFEGTGEADGYRATRPAEEHPAAGWQTEFYAPSYAQLGGNTGNNQEGVSADQRYWLWQRAGLEFPDSLPLGHYLRVPKGTANIDCNADPEVFFEEFELLGCGSEGVDPQALSRFVSADGEHIVFFSDAHLESAAPPPGVDAIYDREAGKAEAEVVSVEPDGDPFPTDATYIGASEDGSTILFSVTSTLYAHRSGQTVAVAESPFTFAGISEDGSSVLYINTNIPAGTGESPPPASLYTCEVEVGPCTDSEPAGRTLIGSEAILVSSAPDGSRVLFTSEEDLPGVEENENGEEALPGEPNLYSWHGGSTSFVAILDDDDFDGFGGEGEITLFALTRSVNPGQGIGRAKSPTRATPDGDVFVFQSHARLTAYDNEGEGEVYRFEPGAPDGKRLLCISCDPTGAPAGGDAMLQIFGGKGGGHTLATTLITNITDDGQAVFFHSPDQLLPEDANQVADVYEWRAEGTGEGAEECKRAQGCLALISSGQGEQASTLFGMSADGHDVFFSTPEKLVGPDLPGSSSIYDARIGGGIPDPPVPAPCQGDACQPLPGPPPALPAPSSTAPLPGGDVSSAPKSCPKGKRKVKSKGKVRCVKKKAKNKKKGQKPHSKGRAAR